MKCVRCGYCCKNYMVIIVDDPEKGIHPDNLIAHMGEGKPCKHLRGDKPGQYSCALHDYPWYKETPCYQFTQVEDINDNPCRLGAYLMKKENKI